MKKENWVWMPHVAHFISGYKCKFRLATYVGGYIVSTVGELILTPTYPYGEKYEEIGLGRLYETMVFKAIKTPKEVKCCPYDIDVEQEVDFSGYNKPEDAVKGHMRLCKKWSVKK